MSKNHNEEALHNTRRKIAEVMKKTDSRVVTGWRPPTIERKEGDTWEDENGKTWERRNGINQSISKLQDAKTPWFCPQCEKTMGHNLDNKVYHQYGFCYECFIAEDHKQRLSGEYEKIQRQKMRANEKAFLKDKISEWEHFLKEFTVPTMYYQDGTYEKLTPEVAFNELKEKIQADLEFMQERLRNIEIAEAEEAQEAIPKFSDFEELIPDHLKKTEVKSHEELL